MPLLAITVALVVACASEEYPAALYEAQHQRAAAPAEDASVATPPAAGSCVHANAQPIPARLVAMSNQVSTTQTVYVLDVWNQFVGLCGSCHVGNASQGGFNVASQAQMAMAIDAKVVGHMTSDNTMAAPGADDEIMPPLGQGGAPWSKRASDDPIRKLVTALDGWLAAGRPATSYSVAIGGAAGGDAGDAGAARSYVLDYASGNGMTNLGSCIPSKELVATAHDDMARLDAMFAQTRSVAGGSLQDAIGLPNDIKDTDLTTLESGELARHGVISFAPGYPLWSDDAKKMRYVRVPLGESIHFDKATQEFRIPPNTRFYKTFLKPVIEHDGSVRNKKIETRLILARPDTKNPDGTAHVNALFGTYRWNDDESDAQLVTSPLRNGQPFADQLITYTQNEPLAQYITANIFSQSALLNQLESEHAIKHYALPSSDRCIQCHMGSNSQSFILGFRPVEIARQPLGTEGVIEPTGPDELNQLQRLIDYGVITGIDSPADVLTLSHSEGSRPPRNDYELTAQSYMVGNCAHCHNPRGFPSVQNPVLVNTFNLLPSPNGGIFQFPLERVSPRIRRGIGAAVAIPYITPSLVDYPTTTPYGSGGTDISYYAKWGDGELPGDTTGTLATYFATFVYAPWRSLIYRNVDTPFPYGDDVALFPHMPMNTPGYDCRVRQIMGDWMVSIPAVRKDPEIAEYANPDPQSHQAVDSNDQPYVEVPPGDPGYAAAVAAAQQRLFIWHNGYRPGAPNAPAVMENRYESCPDTSDIVDPAVLENQSCSPVPSNLDPDFNINVVTETRPVTQSLGPPVRAHWVVTDRSDDLPPWVPRRGDWAQYLVDQNVPPLRAPTGGLYFGPDASPPDGGYDGAVLSPPCGSPGFEQHDQLVSVVDLLSHITLDDAIKQFATTDVPFGTWKKDAGCDYSSVPTVASFGTDDTKPWQNWMRQPGVDSNAHVYQEPPGAVVFNMICYNCHGPNYDGKGRIADTLLTMTGGVARVANLADGVFGPLSSPGANRSRVFGTKASGAVTADDWGARYLAWMALGGTAVTIPSAILSVVDATPVLGYTRGLEFQSTNANMLSTAKQLCAYVASADYIGPALGLGFRPNFFNSALWSRPSPFIFDIGDAELWLRLCSLENTRVLRVVTDTQHWAGKDEKGNATKPQLEVIPYSGIESYPPNAPVGDQYGQIRAGLTDDNLLPWCVLGPASADDAVAEASANAFIQGPAAVRCPDAIAAGVFAGAQDSSAASAALQVAKEQGATISTVFALRGAVNAGFSVFLYLEGLSAGKLTHPIKAKPDYTACPQAAGSSGP